MHAIFSRLRKLVVTGFIFIMPVLITVVVLARFWKHLLKVGGGISKLLRIDTVLGPSGDAVIAVMFFLSVCFVAGLLIRISFLRRVSERIDRRLNELIPGYSQIRSETTKKIGVEKDEEPLFDACLVKAQELAQPGYIIEQNLDGTQHRVRAPGPRPSRPGRSTSWSRAGSRSSISTPPRSMRTSRSWARAS